MEVDQEEDQEKPTMLLSGIRDAEGTDDPAYLRHRFLEILQIP